MAELMYFASGIENRVRREYYSVVIAFERLNGRNEQYNPERIEKVFRDVLRNNPTLTGGVYGAASGPGEEAASRLSIQARPNFMLDDV